MLVASVTIVGPPPAPPPLELAVLLADALDADDVLELVTVDELEAPPVPAALLDVTALVVAPASGFGGVTTILPLQLMTAATRTT
jgi:hypothetical protein